MVIADGTRFSYDALLLATGAEPVRLTGPGFDRPEVHVLRSLADARALIAALDGVKRVAVIGASFIGLEVAASLRHRDIAVEVIAPDALPLERILGPDIGRFVKTLHETRGVCFHLGQGAEAFDGEAVTLTDSRRIAADLVVLGVGVRPRLQLATEAGLDVDKGVLVDAAMRTSDPAIWAAGDIARYPEPVSRAPARIEHWAVAERQGQVAARSMLGEDAAMTDAPFFWSQHYDQPIRYVGHAEQWDTIRVTGSVLAADAVVRFEGDGRLLAAATLGRDLESLKIAAAMMVA